MVRAIACGRVSTYRETGFPHGRSQFIPASETSWAVIALAPAVDAPKQSAAARSGLGGNAGTAVSVEFIVNQKFCPDG